MNNKLKGILSVVILSTAMIGTTVASGHSQTINVVMNSVNLKVNGKSVEGNNILYKGTTYVPLRAAGEILDKEIAWDENTRTATIADKNNPIPNLPPQIGQILTYEPLMKIVGSYENPVGIPSTAILTKTVVEEKYHQYDYRVNLPGGGYIEEIASSSLHKPTIVIIGYDNENVSFLIKVYSDRSLHYTWVNFGLPVLTDDDLEVIRHEAERFLKAYGH